MNKNYHQKEGFTIMEVLVSLAVLVLVIFSATNLVVSIIRSNNENIDTLIAYGLAQEGIEGVRNIRDSNWLLDANFVGELGRTSKFPVWGDKLPEIPDGLPAYYTIDFNVLGRQLNATANTANAMSQHAPWKLSKLNFTTDDEAKTATSTLIKKTKDFTGSKEVRYGHSSSTTSQDTRFHRYLIIENTSPDLAKTSRFKVTSVVSWEEQSRSKEVRLTTELTDWNQGQL